MTAVEATTIGPHQIPIVTVVDDDAAVREALSSLFHSVGWKARCFTSGRAFLACPRAVTPGCLILDITLPDISGLELQQHVADCPELPIIFLTEDHDVLTTVRAMKAGAVEFLTKPVDCEHLLSAVQDAIDHSAALLARTAEMEVLHERYGTLTRREKEVMALVVAGYLNKQVGAALAISEITVKAHRGKVMRKMQAGSLAHLIGMAAAIRLAPASAARALTGIPYAGFSDVLWHAGNLASNQLHRAVSVPAIQSRLARVSDSH